MLLLIKNIAFGFIKEAPLFTNINLEIEEGRIYAILGGNGSGKTTLFNLITGFHKPGSGKILFKGNDIAGQAPFRINRLGIGRTFQDLRLIAKLTVKENVLLALPNYPTDSWVKALLPSAVFKSDLDSLDMFAERIIETFFLTGVRDSPATEISFGQQKLLNLACCVANGAQMLLLDEPVAGISPQYRDLITTLILELKQEGKTILMIEHNTDFIAATAERFLFLGDGSIAAFDTFKQLQNSNEAANAYF